ncbi:Crp/Fnr family transcriptional regulator [Vallitalea sp.]|jgi:CRP-like cAMP-binding protein|uniref:Crp/Fnr family transcriptional regulator n=1 Tax=Vallitalea sp. TaxID=1882829 RepID=UPI0025DCC371|nr:Crp/Fnr family transcriptional regulator [Vallitalea sp.]MCT4688948.1 Crp/Fnr family transcriptional regulator [Vallitalea sp.]
MLINILQNCSLFKNIHTEDIESILSSIEYDVIKYSKEQIISTEGEECNKIGIVLEGNIEVRKIYPMGKSITVTRLNPSDIFGEVILFSNMKYYPSTLVACNSLEVLYISKKQIIDLIEHQSIIMNNLLNVLSSKILTLNKKLRNLSYENMRQKIADFLLSEYKKQQNLYIELNISRKEMAETLGVTRPSLSRELALMKDRGIIDYHKNIIKIGNLQMLEDCLF